MVHLIINKVWHTVIAQYMLNIFFFSVAVAWFLGMWLVNVRRVGWRSLTQHIPSPNSIPPLH